MSKSLSDLLGVGALNKSFVARLDNVREYCEGFPVELWRSNGRVVVRALNEDGCNAVEIDVLDLVSALSFGNGTIVKDEPAADPTRKSA